jgi:GTP-binding protein
VAGVAAHAPRLSTGRRLTLRYAPLVSARPPTFVLFVRPGGALPDSYLRYLANGLREQFDLAGVPLRLLLRTGENPYA